MSIKNNDELIAKAICDYENSIVRIILLCIDNLEFGLGMSKLVQILKGTQTRFITEYSLQNNKAYSLLKQFSKNDIKYIINMLTETGYLEFHPVKNGLANVYKVGIKGYVFLEENQPLEVSFIDAITESEFVELENEQLKLYERLRVLRNEIAKEEDYAAYVVCGELPLRKIAQTAPVTNEEMIEIKGIGPAFIEKYATRFIAEIKRFKEDN